MGTSWKRGTGYRLSRRQVMLELATVVPAGLLAKRAFAGGKPGTGVTVRPVTSGSDRNLFVLWVLTSGLEALGYEIAEPLYTSVPIMHVAVAQGDADICTDHWHTLMEHYYDKPGGDKKMEHLGVLVADVMQGYLIDKATSETHGITNLGQLRDPEIAKIFDNDGDGKADLTGCNPGWGCERVVEHHMDAYDLRTTVHHNQGNYNILIADTIERYKQGEPVLYYTWTPLWLGGVLVPGKDVVWLDVPFSSLPDEDNVDTSLPDGSNPGFGVNSVRPIANKAFLAQNPAARRFMELVTVPIGDVNAQNLRLYRGEDSKADIRRHTAEWIEQHQAQFDAWVDEAASAAM